MGDSLMYSLLPLEAESLGIPLAAVGLLLSINRIVRLGSNTWAGLIFEKLGPRKPFIVASLVAVLTSAVYGMAFGLLAFFIARVIWGFSWSVFRHGGFHAVGEGQGHESGKLMGLLWGLVGLGSAISVLAGGWIYDQYGYAKAVLFVTLAGLLAIPVALTIKWPKIVSPKKGKAKNNRASWKGVLNNKSQAWFLGTAFTFAFFESVLISTASLFIAKHFQYELNAWPLSIGSLAGVLLALRFSTNIIFGPLIGGLSDRIGHKKMMARLSSTILIGIIFALYFPSIWLPFAIALVFIASSGFFITASAGASELGKTSKRPHIFVGFFNTSVDAGAAIGPLFAFSSVIILDSIQLVYLFGAILLFIIMQIYARLNAQKN